jgi:hypothetical protein
MRRRWRLLRTRPRSNSGGWVVPWTCTRRRGRGSCRGCCEGQHQVGLGVRVDLQSALEQPQKRSTSEIPAFAFDKGLESSDQTPADHLDGDPAIRPEGLGDELRGQLREKKTQEEDRLSSVVVVRVHTQITQHVVRQCLDDIASIELEREERDTCECADSQVNLPVSVLFCKH